MKQFLTNYLTILSEIIAIILALIWYYRTDEIEPLIVLIVSTAAVIGSCIALFTEFKKHKKKNVVGQLKERFLDEDFLNNYVPGQVTINKIIEEFGQPLSKIEESVEREWSDEKEYNFIVYRYKFTNAVVLFTTELKDEKILSISLISREVKKHPILCRYSYEEDDVYFGTAMFSKIMIDNTSEFKKEMFAQWGYSSITAQYYDFRPLKGLDFTYFAYNIYENESDMLNQKIDGICVSIIHDVKPIIHFDDSIFM